ncbi:MAG: hypothetical protein QF411_03305 [Planctomycetota bacterium]|jgi:hypothetical protein|nr:hypothetical protein [Planctomycetota bacterium]
MSAWRLGLATVLALSLASFCEVLSLPMGGLSKLALVLWPWMVIVGTPRSRPAPDPAGSPKGRAAGDRLSPAAIMGLLLPPLGLALALDLAAGQGGRACATLACLGLAQVIVLWTLAELARRSSGAWHAHGALWTLGVIGLPLLVTAGAWGRGAAGTAGRGEMGEQGGSAALERVAALSPLSWLHARSTLDLGIGRDSDGGHSPQVAPLPPLAEGAPFLAHLTLIGPLRSVSARCLGGGETRLDLELVAGERLTRPLPLVPRLAPDRSGPPASLSVFAGDGVRDGDGANEAGTAPVGSASWAGESSPATYAAELPPGLLVRPGPPANQALGEADTAGSYLSAAPPVHPRRAALLALLAVIFLVLSLGRYPGAALLLGLVASGGLAFWGAAPVTADQGLEVLEGDLDQGVWTRVLWGSSELDLGTQIPDSLDVQPPEAPLDLHWTAASPGGDFSWWAKSTRGARIRARFRAVAPRAFQPDSPATVLFPLDGVWLRTAAGTWTSHGPLEAGQALPQRPSGAGTGRSGGLPADLPGWLTGAAPPGKTMLVGRRRPAGKGGEGERRAWLRVSGIRD